MARVNLISSALAVTLASCLATVGSARADTNLTIATVNNADMVVMQKLSGEFEKENPGIHLKWVVLEENVLRQRLTSDISTDSGQFDVMTIGCSKRQCGASGAGWCHSPTRRPATTWRTC